MVNPLVAMIRRPGERLARARSMELTGPQSVREEDFLMIGGLAQWVTIRGQDRSNVLVLLIHGGPGSPYTPFNSWLGEWETEFTIVQWDQRGAGRTFLAAGESAPGLTFDRLASDGIELAEYLMHRFARPILLVGSSTGSLTASIMAARRPDLFAALINANVFAPDSARESHRLTLEHAERRGDRRVVNELKRFGPDPSLWTARQAEAVSKRASAMPTGVPDMVFDLMLPALMYAPDLTMADIRAIDRGMQVSRDALHPEYADFDFDALGDTWALPYLIVQGASDLVSPVSAARAWFERITAPRKQMVEVAGSGHLVEFADRSRFLSELRLLGSAIEPGPQGPSHAPVA